MGRVPCCQKDEGLKKGPWTPEEDQKLISFIDKHGHENWRALPKRCGLLRCGKSCRLRWTNYLRPDIKRGRFSQSEEQKIIQLHALVGNKWSFIASQLPKRTDNEIKNYWNTVLKKRMQKISSMFASAQRLLNRKPAASSSSTISSDTTTTTTTTTTATATTNLISPATNLLNSSSSSSSGNDASFSSSAPPSSSMIPPPQDTSSSLLSWSFSINPNNKSTTACSNHISSKTSLLSDILANNGNSTPNPNSKMSQLATVINANPVTSPTITNPNSSTTTTLSTNASSSSSSSSVASSSSSSSSTSSSSFSHLAQWESARLQAEARLNINASIRAAAAGCSNSSLLKMNHINSNIMGTATTTTTNNSNNVVTSSWLSSPINPSLVPAESPTCNNSYNHKYKLNHRSKQQQNRSSSSSSFSLPVDGFNANNNNVDTMSVNPTLKRSSSTINDSTPSPKYSKADADATATANAQAINICSLLLANYKSNSRLNGNNSNNNSSSNNNNFMARSMSMNLSSDRKAVGKIDTNNDDDVLPKSTNPEPCITSALKLGPNGKLTWKTKDLSQLLVSKANTNSISSGPALSAQCSRNKRLWQSEPSPKVAKAGNLSNNSKHMKSARLDHDAIHDQFMNNVHADRPSSNVNPTSTSISPQNIIDQVIDSHHMDVIQSTGRDIMAIGPNDIDDDSNMVDMDNLSEILLQMESSATCTDDQDHDNIVSTSAWPNQSNDDRLDMVGKGGINPIMEVLNIGEEEEEEEEEEEGEDLEVEIGEEEGNDEDRADETNDDHHQYKYLSKNGKCLDGYSKKNSTSISSADDYAAINDDHPFSQMIMGDDHNNHFNTGYYHHQHNHDIMMMMMMNQYGNNINKDYNMVLPKLVTSDHHDGLITRPSMNSSTNHIHHQHAMYDDHDHQYYNNDSMSGLLMINPYHDEDNDQESCSLLIDHEAMGSHDLLMLGGAAAADDHEIITNGQSSFHMDEILMDHSLLSGKDADADLNVDSIDTSNASQYALQFETLVRELLES